MISILKNSTGYKRLDVYILMNVIQLETLVFCRRYLNYKTDDPCGRQFDQMTQAARSGVKNLTEGSEREATSMQNVLKLLDVAKASLCELRDDYLIWLLDRGLPPWRTASEEAQSVYRVLIDKADYGDDVNYDLARHIIATREKFRPWFGDEQTAAFDCKRQLPVAIDGNRVDGYRQRSTAIESTATDGDRRQSSRRLPTAVDGNRVDGYRQQSTAIESAAVDSSRQPSAAIGSAAVDSSRQLSKNARELAGVRFANAMLILIGRSLNMLGKLMAQHSEEFRREGGFSERMTAARVEAKRELCQAVDEDAPKCPLCGSPMKLRHSSSGDFWGCTAFPTCRGTRPVGGNRVDGYRQQSTAIESTATDSSRRQSSRRPPIAVDSSRVVIAR